MLHDINNYNFLTSLLFTSYNEIKKIKKTVTNPIRWLLVQAYRDYKKPKNRHNF